MHTATIQPMSQAMYYRISVAPGYLRADLYFRKTAAETREFLDAVAAECIRLQCWRVLIAVHSSRPIFTVEKYGFSTFVDLAVRYAEKVAIQADTIEMHIAQDYIAMLARTRNVNMRSFRNEARAIEWLKDRRYRSERRQRANRNFRPERRGDQCPRRHSVRREQ